MMEFLVKVDGKLYEISQLVSEITFKESMNDGCSKLEFSYIDEDLVIKNGSVVSFTYDSIMMFYGYVFSVSRSKGKEISVTAYDQLRYCKVKDNVIISRDTVTTLTNKMCNYFSLKKGTISETEYMLATDVKDNTSWLDIIYEGISETQKNTDRRFLLRDESGLICIRNLEDLQLDLVLGDKNLLYDFNYNKSIDNEFYNQIKLSINGDADNKFIVKKDDASIAKYGLLQYYDIVYNANSSQARSQAETLLKKYNKEVETLSLKCLGDPRIRAGVSFFGSIDDIKYNQRLIVKSVTHEFVPAHTMEVEAML